MATCTVFKNFAIPIENKSLIVISNEIASDKYKTEVEAIQSLIAKGRSQEASQKKQQLPAFTPSATFREKRVLSNIDQYNSFVHLDFDKLKPEQLNQCFQTISQIPYTFLCFRSPSGNGLKVFIEISTNAEHHEIAYKQVQQFYERKLGVLSDPKCKDIPRLCFMSHDPKLYKNIHNQKFEVKQEPENNFTQALQDCVKFTEQKKTYIEGGRNEFLYVFASNCNRKGIPEHVALQFAQDNYNLDHKEITTVFRSAYTHHGNEFAKFANSAMLQSKEPLVLEEDYLKNTPCIPEELYLKMPEILQEGVMAFTDARDRDIFFTSALSILSGCLPGVKGIYAGRQVFPNLFSFIVAPAANGKGSLLSAKELADEYHNSTLKKSREAEIVYNHEMAEYKQKLQNKKKSKSEIEEEPPKPAFKLLFIPANTSYAKILSHLEQNEGIGIICETEADTMGNIFKQEWGSYSDMLRKAFHHERISSSRKTNNEFIEVNSPSLSIALSGTFNQVTGLIASSEDGLFSRFLFYVFKAEQEWKDVSPEGHKVNLTEHFKRLSIKVFEMVEFLKMQETNIQLSKKQWQILNQKCGTWLHDVVIFTGEEASSVVKRLGLILYRICMLFTAFRKFENGEAANCMVCTDEDFDTALKLAEIYLQHSILMYNNLPKQKETTDIKSGDNKRRIFEQLPKQFTRQQAVELGTQFNLSTRTVDEMLRHATGKMLTKPKAGTYQKM